MHTPQTYISLITCLLALTIHPEVQDRAQAEVDMVLGVNAATLEGPHQLPTLSDRANMPYLEALICEVYRWNPVVPLGRSLASLINVHTQLSARSTSSSHSGRCLSRLSDQGRYRDLAQYLVSFVLGLNNHISNDTTGPWQMMSATSRSHKFSSRNDS